MPLVRGLRTLNAIESGNTTSACLETLLTDPGRFSDFSSVMPFTGQVCVLVNSNTAMTAIAGSNNAMCGVFSYSPAAFQAFNSPTSYCALVRIPCLFNFMGGYSNAANNAYAAFSANSCAITYSFTNSNANTVYTCVISTAPQLVACSLPLYAGLMCYFPRLANNLICNVSFNGNSYCCTVTKNWTWPAFTMNGNCCISSAASPCYTFGIICNNPGVCCVIFSYTPLCFANSGLSGNNIIYWGPNSWCDPSSTRSGCCCPLANLCVYLSTNCGQSWTTIASVFAPLYCCNCCFTKPLVTPYPPAWGPSCLCLNRYVDHGFFHIPLCGCCPSLCCQAWRLLSGCVNPAGTCTAFGVNPFSNPGGCFIYGNYCAGVNCCNLHIHVGLSTCYLNMSYFIPQTGCLCVCVTALPSTSAAIAVKCGTFIQFQSSYQASSPCNYAWICFCTTNCVWYRCDMSCTPTVYGGGGAFTGCGFGCFIPNSNTALWISNQNFVSTPAGSIIGAAVGGPNNQAAYCVSCIGTHLVNTFLVANTFAVALQTTQSGGNPCCLCCAYFTRDAGCTWTVTANVGLGNCFLTTSYGTIGCNLVYVFGCNCANACTMISYTGDGVNWNAICVNPVYGCCQCLGTIMLESTQSNPKPMIYYGQCCLIGTIF